MIELINLFLNNLLPIFLAAGAGAALAHFTNLNPRTLSLVTLYIFSPCLIFTLIIKSELNRGELGYVVLLAAILILITGALTWLAGTILRLERRLLAGTILASMFMNAGNYGMPVVLFAFGQVALGYASIVFVTSAVLLYTVGIFIASLGTVGPRRAISNLVRIPMVYALILALLILQFGWQMPLPLQRTVELLGNASIPTMLILLGLQFKSARLAGRLVPLTLVCAMRLLIAPVIAWLLASAMGLTGPAHQAFALEAGMPSAVLNTLIATEFEAEPGFVTAAVFVTTIISPLTLTPLMALLGA